MAKAKEEKVILATEESSATENTSDERVSNGVVDEILTDAAAAVIQGANQTEKLPYEKRPEILAEIARGEEKVPIVTYRDSGRYKGDLYISVGSDNINLQRGKQLFVKRKFADVYQQSYLGDQRSDENIEQMSGKSQFLTAL